MKTYSTMSRLFFSFSLVISAFATFAQIPISYSGKRTFTREKIFDREVVLFPGALLQTVSGGKMVFTKRITVFGDLQVFDVAANIVFHPGTTSELNPCWFGARGDDEVDDTEAFQKVFQLARDYQNSINIKIPIGRYRISETLELGNVNPSDKSINLKGESPSVNSLYGSSLYWIGPEEGTLLRIRNYCVGRIENIDISASEEHLLKHNIEMLPFNYLITFLNCSFAGCRGPGSANVNLNKGNNLQVSEVIFENCVFHGHSTDGINYDCESAVIGGLANTKNFIFKFCSMLAYSQAAINLETTDMLHIENCTFAHNTLDISCLACNTLANSNYSENSKAFFHSSSSYGVAFTTLMNNCYYGHQNSDYIIDGGSGSLVLINNNFGGMGGEDLVNKIKWDSGVWDHIWSIGNFYRNAPPLIIPFEYTGQQEDPPVKSYGDLIGRTALDIQRIILPTQANER